VSEPNVLLVIADSVRARNTTLHGHRHETTPYLADLASTATQYTEARSPSEWSLPSHTSIFTGRQVPEHGVVKDDDRIRPGSTVFDELQQQGYETGLFSSNPYLTSLDTGLASGFDTVEGAVQEPPFDGVNPNEYKGEVAEFVGDALRSGNPVGSALNGIVAKVAWDYPWLVPTGLKRQLSSGTTPASVYTDLFCQWAADTSAPWGACINYMDAHHPYTPREEFDRWDDGTIAGVQQSISSIPLGFYLGRDPWWKCELLEYLYDGAIRQIDHELNRLVQFLRDRDTFDETLVIVTSDHGEGFGEQSIVRGINLAGHNVGENECNLHVPLVVKHPGQHSSTQCDRLTSTTSIATIVRSAVGGEERPYDLPCRPVVARTSGLRAVQRKQLSEEGVDLDPFTGGADVWYDTTDGMVRKRVRWRGRSSVTNCLDSETEREVPEADPDQMTEVFEQFDDAGIRRDDDSVVDHAVEQRLEDLGYR
jgi:arylsulfatase A-like enzyme